MTESSSSIPRSTPFRDRHLGNAPDDRRRMLEAVGSDTLDAFTASVVPPAIARAKPLQTPEALPEDQALDALRAHATKNRVAKCYLGQGYFPSLLPPVLLRNLFENPGWYTPYTPYQAEIAQGRLEMLLNFQTLVSELAGLPCANASLLDESTACAEALGLAFAHSRRKRETALVDRHLHPQHLEVLRTRARFLGITLVVGDAMADPVPDGACLVLAQSPDTRGRVRGGFRERAAEVHAAKALFARRRRSARPMPAGPSRGGGRGYLRGLHPTLRAPHGRRRSPCRLHGRDRRPQTPPSRPHRRRFRGFARRKAFRLALQTREQHIRRDKATSNICTAQVLPAVLSTAYAMYHGPDGLRQIATRLALNTRRLRDALEGADLDPEPGPVFDTLTVHPGGERAASILRRARDAGVNLRVLPDHAIGVSLHEAMKPGDLEELAGLFGAELPPASCTLNDLEGNLRDTDWLPQDVFRRYHTEHEMLRHLQRLQSRDLSLVHSMISLGSCTMKLNAAAEMIPVTWPNSPTSIPAPPPIRSRATAG